MCVKKLTVLLLLTGIAALFGGCAGTSAPAGFLTTAAETQKQAFGAWAELKYLDGSRVVEVNGELISLANDSVTVLTYDNLVTVDRNKVQQLRLTTYDSRYALLAAWTTVGTLSTVSHGYGLVISAPLWILTGSLATSFQSRLPIESLDDGWQFPIESSDDGWQSLNKFARFPQGIPPTIDRNRLQPKK